MVYLTPRDAATKSWQNIRDWMLVLLGLLVLLAFSAPGRPLWFDEFVQFALGGLDTGTAVEVIRQTSVTLNHGQTGIYMLVDHLLLGVFGANALALRAPSFLAAALLLLSAAYLLRSKGFSWRWQAVSILALAATNEVMRWASEARPYMFLASTTLATLAFYQAKVAGRKTLVSGFLGTYGLIFGAILHPFFPLMAAAVFLFSLWMFWRTQLVKPRWMEVFRFLNVPLVATSAALFFATGWATWMREGSTHTADPFYWWMSPGHAMLTILTNHWPMSLGILISTAFMGITVAVLIFGRPLNRSSLLPPTVLALVGIATSIFISGISFYRSYWIIERQWIAGMAISIVAVVWFFAEYSMVSSRFPYPVFRVVAILFAALITASGLSSMYQQISKWPEYRTQQNALRGDVRPLAELLETANDNDSWVYLGNLNIARGGPVWPELAGIYKPWITGVEALETE
jgi:hypothetical protein